MSMSTNALQALYLDSINQYWRIERQALVDALYCKQSANRSHDNNVIDRCLF